MKNTVSCSCNGWAEGGRCEEDEEIWQWKKIDRRLKIDRRDNVTARQIWRN